MNKDFKLLLLMSTLNAEHENHTSAAFLFICK